eukprot:TCONS_00014586-protein
MKLAHCTLIVFLIHTLVGPITLNDTATCPILQEGCECTHKFNGQLKIVCRDVEVVSLSNLSSNVSFDIIIKSDKLKSINASSFPHPNVIRKLVLRDNSIKTIEKGTFEGFNALVKLDLSNNHLVEIISSTFRGLSLSNLTELKLGSNRILQVSKTAFADLNIELLDLSNQKDAKNNDARLISYSDFLSFSFVKRVDLSGNRLLCDCNMQWLPKWAAIDTNEVSNPSRCFYPAQLEGALLSGFDDTWDCAKYKADFTIPEFHLYPYKDQVMFENDNIEYHCYTTWMEFSSIIWLSNGQAIPSNEANVTISAAIDLTTGSLSSTLTIDKLSKKFHGNITCKADVWNSGVDQRSRNVIIISSSQKTCPSNTSKTDRGNIFWPMSLSGAQVKSNCPFGSLVKNTFAARDCGASGWSKFDVNECLFSDLTTQKLQLLYAKSRLHSFAELQNMAPIFNTQFADDLHTIKTKYDLYFFCKILDDIRITYKGIDGTRYSLFYWNAIGALAEQHTSLTSMSEKVYGHTAMWRFRKLLEDYIEDQIQLETYRKRYYFHDHHGLTASAYTLTTSSIGNELHCYLTVEGKVAVTCYPSIDYKANKAATILMTLDVGRDVKVYKLTLLSFSTASFFQTPPKQSKADIDGGENEQERWTTSSIMGLKFTAQLNDGSETRSIRVLRMAFIKSAFNLDNPRFVYWSNIDSQWKTSSFCVKAFRSQRNASSFRCHNLEAGNMTYLAVLTKKPLPTILTANLLEPIVYVGASLVCVLLILTLGIFIYFSYVRQVLYNRADSVALINLCIALLIAEIIFANGIHRVDDALLCTGVAAGLHYFILCALVWLGCGAVALLRLVKKKDRADVKSYDPVMKYYLMGWGLPLIVCSITLAFKHSNYGTSEVCWLSRGLALGAFVGIGGVISLANLIVFGLLHYSINRLFPAPIERREDDDSGSSDDENADENRNNGDECSANQCRYKQPKIIVPQSNNVVIPKRKELLQSLHGGLLVLLLLIVTVVNLIMVYSYKNAKARYLYFLFTYGGAISNFLVGFVIFYHFCFKRKDLRKLLKQTFIHFRHKNAGVSEAIALVTHDDMERQNGSGEVGETENEKQESRDFPIHAQHENLGVFGMSDHVISDGSQYIPSIAPEAQPSEVEDQQPDEKSEILDSSTDAHPQTFSKSAVTEVSESERLSNAPNSIGDCSLVSSNHNKRQKTPPKPVDIPTNLKNFVPENWRPARRRMNKGASYYPYYASENAPISASLAYSSKSSSLASTNVGGIPLYKNNHPTNMNGMRPRMAGPGPMPLQPPPPQRYQPTMAPPPPRMVASQQMYLTPTAPPLDAHPMTVLPLSSRQPVIEEVDTNTQSSRNEEDFDVYPEINPVKSETELESELESDEEEAPTPLIVSPNLYIPMPHVSIKQFILRNETSV